MFRELSVPGNDEDVVFASAIQVNGERAHDFRQETPGFDKLCKRSTGKLTRIVHAHAGAFLDAPGSVWMSVWMSFCGDELVLKKEADDVVNQSFLRTFQG